MVRAKPIDSPAPWRQKLARPVRRVQRIAFAVLAIAVILIVLAVAWLVTGIAAGTLTLALWQQVLIVIGLILLIGLAGFAFRVAFFARVVRAFIR